MGPSAGTSNNAKPVARADRASGASFHFKGGSRDRQPLKLVGALRGDGSLIWSGGKVAVRYELDLFARGDVRTATGHLEGELATAGAELPDDQPPEAARLRLDDGRELDIELVAVSAAEAEFEASAPAVGSCLRSPPSPKPRRPIG